MKTPPTENKISTLPLTPLKILIYLRKSGKQESISTLSDFINRRYCIVHQGVNELEKLGYIELKWSGRCKEISLTPKGLRDINDFLGI